MENTSVDNRVDRSGFKMFITGYLLLRFVLFPLGMSYLLNLILSPVSAAASLLSLWVISFKDDVPLSKPIIDKMALAKLSRTDSSLGDMIDDSFNYTFELVYKFEYAILDNVSYVLKNAASYLDPIESEKTPSMLFASDLPKPVITFYETENLSDEESNSNSSYPAPRP